MASFRTEDLAIVLGPFNEVEDNGYQVLIYCAEISALNPEGCSGTHPKIKVSGEGLDELANLSELRAALYEALAQVADLEKKIREGQPSA